MLPERIYIYKYTRDTWVCQLESAAETVYYNKRHDRWQVFLFFVFPFCWGHR